jgi:O-antigen/teichoic acid export membrane protein
VSFVWRSAARRPNLHYWGMHTAAAEPTTKHDVLDTSQAGPAALRGSALRSGAYVAGLLLSIVSAPLLIRHLGNVAFGQYVTVVALVTIVAGLTEGGLNVIVLRGFSTLGDEQRRAMMRSAIGIRLLLTFAGVALVVAFAIIVGYSTAMVIGTVLAGAGLVLQLLQSLLSMTLQSRLRFGWASAIELLRQVVSVALIVALVIAGAGLVPMLAIAIPAAGVSLAITIPLVARYTPLTPSFHVGHWWHLLRESIPWATISAVNIIYLRIAIVVMSLIATAVQTGYFAISFRIMEVLIGVPGMVIAPIFPILARSERNDRIRFARTSGRLFELSLLMATWLVVCVEVGAGFGIHVLADDKADPAITVLRIQGLSLIGNFMAMACGFPLLTMRRYRPVLIANLLALITSATITLLLAPSLGARGGALAVVVGETGLALVSGLILTRALPDASLPLGAIPIAALAGCTATAAGVLLPIHPIAGVIVATGVYLAVLALCRRLPPELSELLGGIWGTVLRGR